MSKKYSQFADDKLVVPLRDDYFDNRVVFEHIYRKHVNELYKCAKNRLTSKQENLNIIQKVYTDLWQKRNSLSKNNRTEITSIFQYLVSAINLWIVRYMSRHSRKYEEHYNFFEWIYELLERSSTKLDFETDLLKNMRLLPAQYQEIVLLRFQGRKDMEVM